MKILFDQGVPKPLRRYLAGHDMQRAFQLGWARTKNGELIALAQADGFHMIVSTDQNLRHQQNLQGLKLAVFVLGRGNWLELEPFAPEIAARIDATRTPGVHFFPITPTL